MTARIKTGADGKVHQCAIVGCERDCQVLDMCDMHYRRKRSNSPVADNPNPLMGVPNPFLRLVSRGPDCWFWLGSVDREGYGRYRSNLAHRLVYTALVGKVPEGLVLDHLCRVRHCVNPAHLEPVTPYENAVRGLRSPEALECINGHPYTEENTYRYLRKRACRTCRRERAAAYRARRSAA